MLGQKRHLKRKLEDDLQDNKGTPNAKEWKRCMEGFSEFSNLNTKQKKVSTHKRTCQTFLESSFDKLSGFNSDASGQNELEDDEVISWSSSDGEESTNDRTFNKKQTSEKKELLQGVKSVSHTKEKKDTKRTTPIKARTPKVTKLELQRLSPCFEEIGGVVSSEGDIDSGCSSPEGEEDQDGDQKPWKPATHLANLPKQTTPVKISKKHAVHIAVESPTIGSIQSGSTSNSDSPGTSGMKASDWLKGLDWQTPRKAASQEEEESMAFDSAKKKRIKYTKDGLASRLSRLKARERTAVRIWQHQKADDIDASDKACLVEVLHFETLYSLQVAHCNVARIASVGTHEQGGEGNSQKSEGGEGNSLEPEGGEWKEQIILFSKHMMEKFQIEAGTLLKIYPPWQQLQLTSVNKTVLLCTNYIRVISNNKQEDNFNVSRTDVSAQWSCPCARDPSICIEDCAVRRMPYRPAVQHVESTTAKNNETSPNCILETVNQSHAPATTECESLLESIQKTSVGRPLCFKAVVQRVFCSSQLKYSLLVEDSHGVMAVVDMGDNSEQDSIIQSEGRVCVLSGLKVITRTNKERNHTLFTVMERSWSGHMIALSSQESQGDDTAAQIATSRVTCPGFCYLLAPENELFTVTLTSTKSSSFRKPELSTLDETEQVRSGKRVSFVARIIFRRKQQGGSTVWYGLDDSIGAYITVSATANCFVPQSTTPVLLFTDVLKVSGKLQADCYTRVWSSVPSYLAEDGKLRERYEQLTKMSISLPAVCLSSQPSALVSVEGEITGIDEESAYSWEECDKCGSDRLMDDNSGASTCEGCKRRVTSPVTRMKMEAFIRNRQNGKKFKLKVDLLQSTVEKLLPSNTDDEGYDIDCVLNKHVGPLRCFVTAINTEVIKLKEFE